MGSFIKSISLFLLGIAHPQTCRYGAYPLWMKKYGSDINANIETLKDFDLNYNSDVVSSGRV